MADESTKPGDVWRYLVSDVLQKSCVFRTDSKIEKYLLDKLEVIEKQSGASIFERPLKARLKGSSPLVYSEDSAKVFIRCYLMSEDMKQFLMRPSRSSVKSWADTVR